MGKVSKPGAIKSAPNRFPYLAARTLRLPIKNLLYGEAVADPLEHSKGIEEVTLPAGIRADENVETAEIERYLFKAFEALNLEVRDHAPSLFHTISPFTFVAMGPPRKVFPWNGEFRLRDSDWFTS